MKKKNGFTLVELLAVIVILAIILVIAVPQIMDTIDSARKASLESSVKMVAAQAENQYTVAQTLGTTFATAEGTPCGKWAGIDTTGNDYASCTYSINTSTGAATVVIKGKDGGKFDKFKSTGCSGTRTTVTCTPDS